MKNILIINLFVLVIPFFCLAQKGNSVPRNMIISGQKVSFSSKTPIVKIQLDSLVSNDSLWFEDESFEVRHFKCVMGVGGMQISEDVLDNKFNTDLIRSFSRGSCVEIKLCMKAISRNGVDIDLKGTEEFIVEIVR